MEFEFGKYYFHYTNREAALGQIIPRGSLRLSSMRRMRDPLENTTMYIAGASGVGPRTGPAELKRNEGVYIAFNYLAQQIRERARLLALTVDSDRYSDAGREFARGWSRPRMWEHYAEKHAGVCLVFEARQLGEELRSDAARLALPPLHDRRVSYTETGAAGLTLALDLLPDPITEETVSTYISEHRDELFFRKALDWETEHEHRFLATAPEGWDKALYLDFGASLKAAIFGEKFPAWQRAAAHDVCGPNGVEVLRLDWTLGRPNLEELPVGMPSREESERLVELLVGTRDRAAEHDGG